jgi:hypothetical protein
MLSSIAGTTGLPITINGSSSNYSNIDNFNAYYAVNLLLGLNTKSPFSNG